MQTRFDAVIIGAGPAGSSAAILLARAGWAVALVEKQRFPRRKVCGECIAASNLPLLEALGIGPAVESLAGHELRKVAFMRGDHRIVADLPAAAHAGYRWGRALGRETLDVLLVEQARAAGAEVLQPCMVQAISGGPGDWRCRVVATDTKAELTLHAPLAIAAHGSWEVLPSDRPRQRRTCRPSDLLAFKANFHQASLEDGLLPILSFDGGYGGMVVADDGMTTVACCIRRDHLEAARRASPGNCAGDVVEALLMQQCSGVRKALSGARRDGAWLAAGPLAPGVRLCADDELFRIGNAAGEVHPIIGEGISMALQSSWLLCTQLLNSERHLLLSDRTLQREAARRYASAWRHHFKPRLRLAAAFAHVAMRPTSAALLTSMVRAWPGLLTLGASWAGKVCSVADPASIDVLTQNAALADLIRTQELR